MPDFKALLSTNMDDVKRPPALPQGTYFGTIVKHEYKESPWEDKKTGEHEAQVVFSVRVDESGPGVDPDEAAAAGVPGKVLPRAFSIERERQWAVKQFLEGLGIKTSGRLLDSLVPETLNAAVMFEVTQRFDKKDPDRGPFNDIKAMRSRA